MDKDKLIHQLFIGKVTDIIGKEKTRTLLNEAKEAFDVLIVIDCGACKHQEVSKYVNPCYNCRDNDGFDNFESAIIS